MDSKLIVDLSTGHLEVSGSEDLVKYIFNEFRAEISARSIPNVENVDKVEPERKQVREIHQRKSGSRKSSAISDVNKDLDTLGVEDFFHSFAPKNDAERAMVFVKFLREKKQMSRCESKDVYTCFFVMKSELKLPNMAGLLNNDSTRTKYFTTPDAGLELTRIGEIHFSQKLKKNATTS